MRPSSLSLRATGPLAPLVGILIGALGGALYWLASLLWPSSVAVILAMAATVLASALASAEQRGKAASRLDPLAPVLCLLVKFNTLMALSAAKLPFAAPAYFPLALIMICGYAASYALPVFVMAVRADSSALKITHLALILALALGFAPATLLGIPGLIGLASAVIVGLSIMAFLKYRRLSPSGEVLELTQLATEAAFYLGALASWRFV